jgi:hypothetical protein
MEIRLLEWPSKLESSILEETKLQATFAQPKLYLQIWPHFIFNGMVQMGFKKLQQKSGLWHKFLWKNFIN